MVSRMPRSSGSSCAVKLNSRSSRPRDLQHLGHVPVRQDGVGREVLGDLAEAGLEAGLAARAADARFGVADDARGAVDHAGFDQRPDGQVGGRRIAARVGHQARAGNALAAEFRQPVDGLGQQFRLGVRLLVPGRVVLRRAQAEGAAQVDHPGAGLQHGRRQLHGDFRRGGQEDQGKSFGMNGFCRARQVRRGGGIADRGVRRIPRDGPAGSAHLGVPSEKANQFRAAIAAISDNAAFWVMWLIIRYYE